MNEPSDTQFGRLVRSGEANLRGRSLALAVAADRHQQQENLVQPLVKAGKTIISDRYVPSSLVLQRIDGMSLEEIWQYNKYLPAADVTFYLDEDATVIQRRVDSRGKKRSRLELEGSAERELLLYREARTFLADESWRQILIACNQRPPEEICEEMVHSLRVM